MDYWRDPQLGCDAKESKYLNIKCHSEFISESLTFENFEDYWRDPQCVYDAKEKPAPRGAVVFFV